MIHAWWYFTLVIGLLLCVLIIGTGLGGWGVMKSLNFGIEWEMSEVKTENELSITIKDKSGREYPVNALEGKGILDFDLSDGMGRLAIPFLTTFIILFGLGLWGIFQLRKLFDNLAKEAYFERVNAIRVRHIAYSVFGFLGLRLIIQILFETMFIVETGNKLSVSGVEIGITPLFIGGLFLLALSEVLKEAANIKAEQDLTI